MGPGVLIPIPLLCSKGQWQLIRDLCNIEILNLSVRETSLSVHSLDRQALGREGEAR